MEYTYMGMLRHLTYSKGFCDNVCRILEAMRKCRCVPDKYDAYNVRNFMYYYHNATPLAASRCR